MFQLPDQVFDESLQKQKSPHRRILLDTQKRDGQRDVPKVSTVTIFITLFIIMSLPIAIDRGFKTRLSSNFVN